MRWISKNKCLANRNINSLLKTQYAIRAAALFLLSAISVNAMAAGGFGLGSTRLVYPSDSQQITLSVQNGGANTSYLIQSWIDDNQSSKKKSGFCGYASFIYVANPKRGIIEDNVYWQIAVTD